MSVASARTRGATAGPGKKFVRVALIAVLALWGSLATLSPVSAGSFQPDGSYSGTPAAAVSSLFAANPNGGDAFVAAVRALLIANPDLADDVAYLAARGSAGQQAAAADGMAQAFIVLTHRGNTNGASRIVSAAQRSGNAVIQNAMTSALGRSTVFANQSGNPVTGQSNCRPPVSPSSPTACE